MGHITPDKKVTLISTRSSGGPGFIYTGKTSNRLQRRWRTLIGLTDTKCVPECVPWPYTSDINGQSWPTGTVGVRFKVTSNQLNDFDNGSIYPVPGTLPSGYTLRKDRDWIWNPQGGLKGEGLSGGGSSSLPPNTYAGYNLGAVQNSGRVRSIGALTNYDWTPGEAIGNSCFHNGDPPSGVPRTTTPFWTSAPTVGWRYFRYQEAAHPSTGLFEVAFRLEIRCNSDGTNTGIGDTLLKSFSIPFHYSGNYDSGYYTGPELQMPLGTRKYMWVGIYSDYGSGGAVNILTGSQPWFNIGPRCDIPFPFSVPGSAENPDLFAPGGIVAGAVPGY